MTVTETIEAEAVAPATNGDDGLSFFDEPFADEVHAAPRPTRQLVDELPEIRRRVVAWARDEVATIHESILWMYTAIHPATAATTSWWRRARYRGRHGVQRHWFGRERSTAEATSYMHRTYQLRRSAERRLTAPAPDPEVELPGRPTAAVYWVGWIELGIEFMRGEFEVLHPLTKHRLGCS